MRHVICSTITTIIIFSSIFIFIFIFISIKVLVAASEVLICSKIHSNCGEIQPKRFPYRLLLSRHNLLDSLRLQSNAGRARGHS
jgi:hypothetical protein